MNKSVGTLFVVSLLSAVLSYPLHANVIVGYSPDVSATAGIDASVIDSTGSSASVTVDSGGAFGDVICLRPSAGGTSGADAIANNDYFQFTLTAQPGYAFDLDSMDFEAYNGGTSTPRGWALTSSLDGFSSILDENTITANLDSVSPDPFSVDLSTLTGLSDITLRMYGYAPASNLAVDFHEVVVNGTV